MNILKSKKHGARHHKHSSNKISDCVKIWTIYIDDFFMIILTHRLSHLEKKIWQPEGTLTRCPGQTVDVILAQMMRSSEHRFCERFVICATSSFSSFKRGLSREIDIIF